MDERLLALYDVELRHLRESAAEFGRDPKIAGRLSLDPDGKEICPDPYVERLLEGFAFLAARVHLKLDAEFPRFSQGLLETVYPDYLCPVPSMAIVKFVPEEQEAALAPGFVLKRGTLLRSQLGKGERTSAPSPPRRMSAYCPSPWPRRVTSFATWLNSICQQSWGPRQLFASASARPSRILSLRFKPTSRRACPWRGRPAGPDTPATLCA